MEDIKQSVVRQAMAAKTASRKLALLSTEQKNAILLAMADALDAQKENIIFHNEIDVDAAKETGLAAALIDRLTLTERRISEMAQGLRAVAAQADPIGGIVEDWTPPSGIHITQVRVPLGVIAMIYESRPNVTVDAAGLCLKAGNAVILRGGSEAINSNHMLIKIITVAAAAAGLPDGAIQFMETTDRQAVAEIIKLDQLIDLVIPRGGEEMIRDIRQNATVPVLAHGKGLCHTYIDKAADAAMAKKIAVNAKCQRPGVCNAMETLLVHADIAPRLLPELFDLYVQAGVEVRGDKSARAIVPAMKEATEVDWSTEYLELILSIKIVASLDDAIHHINRHGSGHSEAIITGDSEAARRFLSEVDAAAIFHNASTRMHDGSVFGLGAEIGISTQKLHARGTMGVKELTTTKYLVYGTGNIRE
ncbi:MAG: glutamate-5-semialdehyde dehydrogenase [Elusimicrobia bacterium]|nr:glutamate-5-semialdehyde dehydrogenase [Elusimicrobiota bacterium]